MRKILKRFIDIWKLDFLTKFLLHEKSDNKTTIWFWIISNSVLTLALLVSFSFFLIAAPSKIITVIEENIPDGARITITDGQLTTENIDEPFFREVDTSNEGINYDKKIAVIIDTHGQTYDITSLDEYEGGFLVLGDRVYTKNDTEINQLVFTEVPNLSFSKEDAITFVDKYFIFPVAVILVVVVGISIFFYFVVLRLISAFWWALMLFIIMRIFDVKESYMIAYKAVLNFYFIPAIVALALGFVVFTIPFVTTIIFVAIFIANMVWLKRQSKKESTGNFVKDVKSNIKKKEEGATSVQTKK